MLLNVIPGRVDLLCDQESTVNDLAEAMNFAGFSVAVFRDVDSGSCTLSVPEAQAEKARAYLNDYINKYSQSRKDEELQIFRSRYLERAPRMPSPEDTARNRTVFSSFFLYSGLLILLLSVVIALTGSPGRELNSVLLLYFSFGFFSLFFGLYTYTKAREVKSCTAEEKRFRDTILSRFYSTYSAQELDRMLRYQEGNDRFEALTTEGLAGLRRELIRDYLRRDYVFDAAYYEDRLVEELYAGLYEV